MNKVKKKITNKQRSYLKELIKNPGNSKYQNALNAGYTETMAKHVKEKIEDEIKDPLAVAFKKAGITDELLAGKVKEGMYADLVKIASHEGKIKDEKSYTDYETRRKYVEMVYKLKGDFVDRVRHEGDIDNPILNELAKLKESMGKGKK